ncbi:O-methyltransferase [Burkholderia ubonensis]|uniref:O-methyltransferase n=1 Tax=Burkholderia ubonensis TaxID=101571 RepID=UPI0007548C00|nr:class I SAM-dependent methyltransferase [Burkholderia ubonensis]KVG77554.1 SAM-dependent methyltransferase [Burkholderia ubonensis]KVH16059.1 SAM-dependent methyltransferase [Burkholderia ubonensis]KVH53435.1 SAM-dependent methyltransferase [Burkholderia ubonensis]KVH82595.1 SAM-dependent methyltransferase [Burkholderia ubonensis]KVM29244.1 SAM-dependent methyltransferase [Burkholderia ubonensis]
MASSTIALLQRLHEESRTEIIARARAQFQGSDEAFLTLGDEYEALAPRLRGRFLDMLGMSTEDFASSESSPLSLAVSAETGRFLRNMVLSQRPARILELGSSCGVSTLYFADALRTLGRGVVVATERDARKCAHLRDHVKTAGLDAHVDMREGDVFETVAELDGTFDMVFIDVWADAYLKLFTHIERLLRPGSVVLADNMYTAEDAVRPYKHYLDDDPRFSTTTLAFESGVEFTVVVS